MPLGAITLLRLLIEIPLNLLQSVAKLGQIAFGQRRIAGRGILRSWRRSEKYTKQGQESVASGHPGERRFHGAASVGHRAARGDHRRQAT